jgi:hypothetical protein
VVLGSWEEFEDWISFISSRNVSGALHR